MSLDARDLLELPVDAQSGRPTKKQKSAPAAKPLKGLAREVQSLGGDNPIAIVPEVLKIKKRRFANRKPAARWHHTPFRNSAHPDPSFRLNHWRKATEDATKATSQPQPQSDGQSLGDDKIDTEGGNKPEVEDSAFAKFNVKVEVPHYNDNQYNANLVNDDWSRHETDYLMDLVEKFELRWPLVWDRYEYTPPGPENPSNGDGVNASTDPNTAMVLTPKDRSMEDLKKRYYDVAAKMMTVQKPVQYMNPTEFSLHETMANFDPAAETERKKFAKQFMGRSREEAMEEERLLTEVRRIQNAQARFNEHRHELYRRLDYPSADKDISAFKTSAGLATLLQNLMVGDKSKKRKTLMDSNGANTPGSAQPASAQPNSTPVSDSRRGSIAASNAGHRDSIGGGAERPDRPAKKGAQPAERKKLTEQEDQLYGVSYHDRLPSGPTFRYERINKILTTKSNAQHTRIVNTLAELGIPQRPTMPTKAVVEGMEKLLYSIGVLLDLRKLNDKLDSDMKVEQFKKSEREAALKLLQSKSSDDAGKPAEGAVQPGSSEKAREEPQGSVPAASTTTPDTGTTEAVENASTNEGVAGGETKKTSGIVTHAGDGEQPVSGPAEDKTGTSGETSGTGSGLKRAASDSVPDNAVLRVEVAALNTSLVQFNQARRELIVKCQEAVNIADNDILADDSPVADAVAIVELCRRDVKCRSDLVRRLASSDGQFLPKREFEAFRSKIFRASADDPTQGMHSMEATHHNLRQCVGGHMDRYMQQDWDHLQEMAALHADLMRMHPAAFPYRKDKPNPVVKLMRVAGLRPV
ncbi:SWR1-complex protein 4 [Xylariaceae sp. FL1019]|nr:SWR1-complex protein 4 [Xylariaceae sp. FL1019]